MRPVRPDHAWAELESNRFGKHEFFRYCKIIGAEPYICINAGLGTVDDARQCVEYCKEGNRPSWTSGNALIFRETARITGTVGRHSVAQVL